jgi:hypothetical protein
MHFYKLVHLIIVFKYCQVVFNWKITSVRQEFRREGDHVYYRLLQYVKLSTTREFRGRHRHTTSIAVTVTNATVVRTYQDTTRISVVTVK